MSSTRKNPYLWKVYGNSWERRGGGGGVLKAKILEAKYEAELEFPGGSGGCKTKTFRPWGGGGGGREGDVWIFSGTAQSHHTR